MEGKQSTVAVMFSCTCMSSHTCLCIYSVLCQHEDGSVMMLDHLLEENGLREEFGKYELKEQDIDFIKEMIAGPLQEHREEEEERKEDGLDIVSIKDMIPSSLQEHREEEEEGKEEELDEKKEAKVCESPLGYSAIACSVKLVT